LQQKGQLKMAGKRLEVFILLCLSDQISGGNDQYRRDNEQRVKLHDPSPPFVLNDSKQIIA